MIGYARLAVAIVGSEYVSPTCYMGESPDDLSVYCNNTLEARWLVMWGLIGEWHVRNR